MGIRSFAAELLPSALQGLQRVTSGAPAAPKPQAASFAALTEKLSYLGKSDLKLIREAYKFADEAHLGQFRASGEPYITHPIAVAGLVADWRLDAQAVMAALMHDAMEDCGITKSELIGRFGAPTADLVEVDHPHRRDPDTRGKSDSLDAIRAARTAIGRTHHTHPRQADGPRDALRVLMIARHGAINTRTDAIRQLKAIIIGLPDATREKLRGVSTLRLPAACAKLTPPRNDPDHATTIHAMRAIARRAIAATKEAEAHQHAITVLVTQIAPHLLDLFGVGPISAARILISWSHHGRLRSEACFARLAGVAPIPASSGNTTRHRLDRGGDRQHRQRDPHDRPRPRPTRPRNHRLHPTTNQRRQNPPRSHPGPQTPHRPTPLPTPGGHQNGSSYPSGDQ